MNCIDIRLERNDENVDTYGKLQLVLGRLRLHRAGFNDNLFAVYRPNVTVLVSEDRFRNDLRKKGPHCIQGS